MNPPTTLGAADDVLLAHGATGLLAEFNAGGVLDASDVRTALAIGRIGGERDERVLLALALTVRALRSGSVCVDLATASATAFDDSETGLDLVALPWPEPESWQTAVLASPLTGDGPESTGDRPMRQAGGLLYLERYWHQEEQVRTELQRRLTSEPPTVDTDRLRATLDRLFEPTPAGGRPAARCCGQRARAGDRAGRRAGHGQDDHRGPAAGHPHRSAG